MRRNKYDKQSPTKVEVIDLCDSDDEDDRKPAAAPFGNGNRFATTKHALVKSRQPVLIVLDDDVKVVKVKKPAADPWRIYACDAEIARILELQTEMETTQWLREQEFAHSQMKLTPEGRAWQFVNEVLVESETLRAKNPTIPIRPVARDDLYYMTLNLLETQEDFLASNIDGTVDVGYHYTSNANLKDIRTNGLLTKNERQQQGVTAAAHGAYFGDGVYTADNPFAFSNYGDIGLICARLRGTTKRVIAQCATNTDPVIHCLTGNKLEPSTTAPHFADEVVLQSSSQIIPMLQFEQQHIINDFGNPKSTPCTVCQNARWCDSVTQTIMEQYIATLCNIIKATFVGGPPHVHGRAVSRAMGAKTIIHPGPSPPKPLAKTAVQKIPISAYAMNRLALFNHSAPTNRSLHYAASAASVSSSGVVASSVVAPANLPPRSQPAPASHCPIVSASALCETIQYHAPDTLHSHNNLRHVIEPCPTRPSKGAKCAICLFPMCPSDQLATLLGCGHTFHKDCLQNSLLHASKCPICRSTVGKVQGKMPSGTMTITVSPSITCDGFASGTIVISYSIPSAIQKSYHDNPGVAHDAALRTAYLPNNRDGQMLLKRLKFAFRHGLSFTVSRSLTTGRDNSVTWTSIHHKTSPNGGHQAHGFPDAGYFVNCNEDLDALGVPAAHQCP
jgi:deltex-like protein